MRAIVVTAALYATCASAQSIMPPADARIQRLAYQPNQVVPLDVAPGYQLMIELASDEQVQSVALGEPGAWQVTANRAGNLLFVRALQLDADTNMTVVTNVRHYAFDLSAGGTGTAPYVVRFDYPAQDARQAADADPAPVMVGAYRLAGARHLRPNQISDDGVQTYIGWPADAALPATYLVDDAGRETLANGMMRGDLYVVDGVAQRLLFRLDKQVARARRVAPVR